MMVVAKAILMAFDVIKSEIIFLNTVDDKLYDPTKKCIFGL
jgi:hypothetical protein